MAQSVDCTRRRADPASSRSVEPRSLTSRVSHTYTKACARTITVGAVDDDGGASPARSRPVVVLGTTRIRHAARWWTTAYRGQFASVGPADRPCLLSTARSTFDAHLLTAVLLRISTTG